MLRGCRHLATKSDASMSVQLSTVLLLDNISFAFIRSESVDGLDIDGQSY